MRAYLDNAASTPMYLESVEAMLPYLTQYFGNPSAIHHHGRILRAAIENSRKNIAQLLHCAPAEIVFTSGGTEADNMALCGCVYSLHVKHIITTKLEHHAVIYTAEKLAKRSGIKITYLSVDEFGNISLEELKNTLEKCSEKTLVSLMHANNEIGTLHDIAAIGSCCKEFGALFHSDTVQTIGHFSLNLSNLPVDFVAASAHKFGGPKGVGFLFRKNQSAVEPLLYGGSQERNQRAGTENVAGIVGMAAALEHSLRNIEEHTKHLNNLKQYFKEKLTQQIQEVQFNGNQQVGCSAATILSVVFPGSDPESMLLYNLDTHGISASGGSACTSGSNAGSHVLRAMNCSEIRVGNSIRFSFSPLTTIEEIDYTISILTKLHQEAFV
ncbi:MAG: cysteine desulfurase [Bacteroidia bacterium]|nr:cysteine desulfurase [Bacteroidia bacterium]